MIVELADGRLLTVHEAGLPDGVPVVYHHGTPGAGDLYGPHVHDAEARGIRLVGYDRAGYGGSSPRPGRTVGDVASDIADVCDALGLDRICTWGISGGGPHALACAALLGDRVAAAASLAGVAPFSAEGLNWLAGMGEENLVEFGATLAGRDTLAPLLDREAEHMLAGTPEALRDAIKTLLSPVDNAVLTGEFAAFAHGSMAAALTERRDGWVDDDLAFAAPWGFDVGEIAAPVLVLQGREDRFVPFAHGEWLAARIPGAEARLTDEDGHLTLIEQRVPDVHAWLLERF